MKSRVFQIQESETVMSCLTLRCRSPSVGWAQPLVAWPRLLILLRGGQLHVWVECEQADFISKLVVNIISRVGADSNHEAKDLL